MSQYEHEPAPPEISPVDRYYYDLYWVGEQRVGVWAALDRLFEAVIGESPSDEVLRKFLPDTDGEQVSDALFLLPFTAIGPLCETIMEAPDIEDYYTDAFECILSFRPAPHNDDCLKESLALGNYACPYSASCIQREAGHYLMESVIECDFTQPAYSFDPLATYSVARAKANAFRAAWHGDDPIFYQTHLERYEQLFIKEFIPPNDIATLPYRSDQ